MPGHGQRLELAGLDVRQRRGHLVEVHRHLAAEHVVDGRAGAAVGDVHHRGARAALEQLAPHVADGAVARRRVRHLAGVGLEVLDQLGKAGDRQDVGVDDDHAGRLDDFRHADKVLDRVVGQLGIDRGVDAVRRQRGNAERQAVGRGARHFGGADRAARAGAVFQHHRLLEDARERLLQAARRDVRGAPGRKRNDDAQRFAFLGKRHSRNERCGGERGQQLTALHGWISFDSQQE